ncbi:hypothetical protein UFOVP49_212 [uncultured Caudovirales phage]|uniref:Cupin n=1 Tax=uncultured Caudovirales phage TaxID=2100421 RepID=A0A6J5KPT0_9CAUD|nr:hypothetical protein UFOVP49_212 [uncultured Caudovirales phage]
MRLSGIIKKGWGYEDIFVTNDMYCGKFLHFKEGAKFSMHFHAKKHETWRIVSGEFVVEWINKENAKVYSELLYPGSIWVNEPLKPHRLICRKEGSVLEISTEDSVEDNYRVMPGDSQ